MLKPVQKIIAFILTLCFYQSFAQQGCENGRCIQISTDRSKILRMYESFDDLIEIDAVSSKECNNPRISSINYDSSIYNSNDYLWTFSGGPGGSQPYSCQPKGSRNPNYTRYFVDSEIEAKNACGNSLRLNVLDQMDDCASHFPTTGNTRSELELHLGHNQGDDFWYSWSFFIHDDGVFYTNDTNIVIGQFHEYSNFSPQTSDYPCSPNVPFFINYHNFNTVNGNRVILPNDEGRIYVIYGSRHTSTDPNNFSNWECMLASNQAENYFSDYLKDNNGNFINVKRGEWNTIMIRVKWHAFNWNQIQDVSGFMQMWINNTPVYNQKHGTGNYFHSNNTYLDVNGTPTPTFIKIGQYRLDGLSSKTSISVDEFRIGLSREEVDTYINSNSLLGKNYIESKAEQCNSNSCNMVTYLPPSILNIPNTPSVCLNSNFSNYSNNLFLDRTERIILKQGFQFNSNKKSARFFLNKNLCFSNPYGIINMSGYSGKNISKKVVDNDSKRLDVFPNPTNGLLTVSNSQKKAMLFEVYALNGILVHNGKVDSGEQINLEHLSEGIYLLKINVESETFFEKVIKRS